MALSILKRYTNFNYYSQETWQEWYNNFGNYLFFTELGGYKFMIDTWNHPELKNKIIKFNKNRNNLNIDETNKDKINIEKIDF